MKRENQDMTEENINIIKNIIEDFPPDSPKTKTAKPARKRCKNCNKYAKISNSDSVINKNKKYQISPKTPRSMDKNFTYFKNLAQECENGEGGNEVYISFAEKDNKENKDCNAKDFRKMEKRRKSFFKSSVKSYTDDIRDEVKIFMESQRNQDKVSRNVKEVRLYTIEKESSQLNEIKHFVSTKNLIIL